MRHVYITAKVMQEGKKRYKGECGLMKANVGREAETLCLEAHRGV